MKERGQNVYMPLMMGDWLKGTRGMKAEVRGVYINLLVHQYDAGYVPADMETLTLLDPEIGKVWVYLKDKFPQVAPGKLQNKKLEQVRAFWNKQRRNGAKGGRPPRVPNPKGNPNENPTPNPGGNPKPNLNNEPYLNIDIDLFKEYETWTAQILAGQDEFFNTLFSNSGIAPGEHVAELVNDHLDTLARYPNMRPPDQQLFRKSCIKHIREHYKKLLNDPQRTNAKEQARARARDYLKKYYGDKLD